MMRVLRRCSSRYFFTVFLDSPTLIVRTISPLPPYSRLILSTNGASTKQYGHHVVQNSSRTTLPLVVSFVNFSPSMVLALKRGAGSFALGAACTQRDAKSDTQETAARMVIFRGIM